MNKKDNYLPDETGSLSVGQQILSKSFKRKRSLVMDNKDEDEEISGKLESDFNTSYLKKKVDLEIFSHLGKNNENSLKFHKLVFWLCPVLKP